MEYLNDNNKCIIMSRKDIVYYGYPNLPDYRELINLILTHDKIYDNNDILNRLFNSAQYLAGMLDDLDNFNKNFFKEPLADENNVHTYSDAFVLITSITEYYGLDAREWWTILRKGKRVMNQRIESLDNLNKINEKNSEKFIDIIIPSLRRAKNINLNAFKKTVDTLHEFHLLKKQLVPREKYWKKELKNRSKFGDLVFEAVSLDEEDPKFCSIVEEELSEYDPKSKDYIYDPKWHSFLINDQIMASTELEMPLFMDDRYSNLIKYKFLRGARDISSLKQKKCYEEVYSLFIPEICATDVNEIIELKNQKVFKEFRTETSNIINQWLEDSSSKSNFSDYLNEQYISEIEEFMTNKNPSNKKVLLKGFIGNLDSLIGSIPFFSTLIGGKELIDTYQDKKKYKFALSVIGIKDKIKKYN